MLKRYIKAALEGEHLDSESAYGAMAIVMEGQATPAQISAWLVALRAKGETIDEIAGFARAMRGAMTPLEGAPDGAIDTCGTGGDGLSTFNISTAAGLICAACDVPVAKHGNRAVSSQCGSADVLLTLGFDIDPGAAVAAEALSRTNFTFLFAPRFHPAMKHAAGPRRDIGVRTVFNILGPLCNPASVRRQVVGVYDPRRLEPLARVLGALGAVRAMVVAGPDGADELLPTGENRIAEWDGESVRTYTVTPQDAGLRRSQLSDLSGGDAETNAEILRTLTRDENRPKMEAALFNAGAALVVAGIVQSIAEGVENARAAVANGRFEHTLQAAAAASRG